MQPMRPILVSHTGREFPIGWEGEQMQTIEVNKVTLLLKLRENRDKHRKVFEEALEGWRRNVLDELTLAVAEAKAGKQYRTYFNLPQPEDHTRDYDAIIEQVEWEVEDTITLTQQQFNQFVRDDWGWKEDFLANTVHYMNYKK